MLRASRDERARRRIRTPPATTSCRRRRAHTAGRCAHSVRTGARVPLIWRSRPARRPYARRSRGRDSRVPWRAHRLSTSPERIVSSVNPHAARRAPSSSWQPASSGVRERRAISARASSSVASMLFNRGSRSSSLTADAARVRASTSLHDHGGGERTSAVRARERARYDHRSGRDTAIGDGVALR